jgi:ceramide glucosyltransferase
VILDWTLALLLPVIGGSIFSILCVIAARAVLGAPTLHGHHEPVTILKPCYGLDVGLEENLRSFCVQDYPSPYQVVLSIQRPEDPCLPILRKLEAHYPDRVHVVVHPAPPTVNGKVQNMVGGLTAAKYDLLVISDSDVRVRPDYLRAITAPFADKNMGYVCTPYVIVDTHSTAEHFEALTFNADFVPQVLFAFWSKAAPFCLGASMALRKSALESVGGMAAMGAYLVEDFEMGRRLLASGKNWTLVPHVVEMRIKLERFTDYWSHQVYWDQNTKAANPKGFAATICTRAVPFAMLYVLLNPGSTTALLIFMAAVMIRMFAARTIMERLGDTQWNDKLWLLPFRDCLALASWALALVKRSFVWKGLRFGLTSDGRIVARSADDARKLGL